MPSLIESQCLTVMKTLRCVVIDDNLLDRELIKEYIGRTSFLEYSGEAENPLDVPALLESKHPELLFLDICMPELSGISLLRSLPVNPLTIFTTSTPAHALESYALDALDYLVKPIGFDRFFNAAQKALTRSTVRELPSPFAYVKTNSGFEKVLFEDLRFVEAMENYVVFHLRSHKLVAYLTLKSLEEQLPERLFVRTHKSYLVFLNAIERVEGSEIVIGESRIPISRNYYAMAMEKILGNNLLRR
jgi:two-component system LytT family response regulator